ATATDLAGNTGVASSALNVTIDTTAPGMPVISSFSLDSGTAGDNIPTDNPWTLTGRAEANATVKVYDGATLLGSAVANGTGAWTLTTAALADGAHSLTAAATDAAGNTGATSAAFNVRVDATAPNVPAILSDTIVNVNQVALTGTAEANATVKLYDGAILLGSVTANGAGAWAYTTVGLTNGTHNFTATAADIAGNTSTASTPVVLTLNTPVPSAPVIATFSADSGVVGDNITNDNTLTLTGTAEANSTVKIYDGATLLGSALADASGAWSYSTAALSNGVHAFTATDTLAGLTGTASSALNVTVDTVAPLVPAITSMSTDSGLPGDHITNDNTLTLTGTAEANATVKVYDGATLMGSAVANGAGAWGYTTAPLSNGGHNLTATATDLAGNTSAHSTVYNATVDTIAPTAPVITSFSPDTGVIGDKVTGADDILLAGTSEANSVVKVYDGTTLLGSTLANGNGAWTFDTGTLANGLHNFTANATDAAGNTSSASSALDVDVDTSLSALDVTLNNFIWSPRGLGVLIGSSDPNTAVSVYDADKGTYLGNTATTWTGAWSLLVGSMTNSVHSFVANAVDREGHTGSAHATFGTDGNDIIASGSANETLFGGGGSDTFVFPSNFGKDVVADFQATSDVLQFDHNSFASVADVLSHSAQVGTDVVITE